MHPLYFVALPLLACHPMGRTPCVPQNIQSSTLESDAGWLPASQPIRPLLHAMALWHFCVSNTADWAGFARCAILKVPRRQQLTF